MFFVALRTFSAPEVGGNASGPKKVWQMNCNWPDLTKSMWINIAHIDENPIAWSISTEERKCLTRERQQQTLPSCSSISGLCMLCVGLPAKLVPCWVVRGVAELDRRDAILNSCNLVCNDVHHCASVQNKVDGPSVQIFAAKMMVDHWIWGIRNYSDQLQICCIYVLHIHIYIYTYT